MHRQIWTRMMPALRVLTLASIGMGFPGIPLVAAGEPGEGPLDLAALMLHSDDLTWLLEEQGLLFDDGNPYGMLWSTSHTSIEEAIAAETYAMARGGFTLSRMGEDEAADFLEETGWLRAQDQQLALPDPRVEDSWSLGVAVTIEEYATADGAEEALLAFDDEEALQDIAITPTVERLELPPEFEDDVAAMWKVDTTRYSDNFGVTEIVSLWVQVDTLVVSVALVHAPGFIAPDPDLVAPLMELQLKRIEHAENLYQPHLDRCVPQLEGEQVTDWRSDYGVLNGQSFPTVSETFDDLAQAQEEADAQGIVDAFVISQNVGGTQVGAYDGALWYAGRLRAFVDDDRAAEFLANTQDWLEDDGYTQIEELDDVPDLGDGTAAYTYTGSDDYTATIVYVQVDDQVFSVRLGSATEPVPDAVYDLAERQVERLESGDCSDPLTLPRGL